MTSQETTLVHSLTRDRVKQVITQLFEWVPRDYAALVHDFCADWNNYVCRVSFEARDESVSGTIQVLPDRVQIAARVPTILCSLWRSLVGTISDCIDEAHS